MGIYGAKDNISFPNIWYLHCIRNIWVSIPSWVSNYLLLEVVIFFQEKRQYYWKLSNLNIPDTNCKLVISISNIKSLLFLQIIIYSHFWQKMTYKVHIKVFIYINKHFQNILHPTISNQLYVKYTRENLFCALFEQKMWSTNIIKII